MSTIRECPLSGKKVIIAPERLHRPIDFPTSSQMEDDLTLCPFEPGSESATPDEIFSLKDQSGEWITRVVPNRYHALSIEEYKHSAREGFYNCQTGLGAHEVIIETPIHSLNMDHYTIAQYKAYLKTIISRIKDLREDMRLEYIQVFKNHGLKAGATLKHPHSQIIATAFIPPHIDRQIQRCRDYYKQHRRPLLLDIVHEELHVGERIVYEDETFVAFTPYASSFAFEVMIAPKVQISSIEEISVIQKSNLSHALKEVYKALYGVLGEFDFNMLFFNAPPYRDHVRADYFHQMEQFFTFYIQITPRIYTLAGYELSTDMQINPITPESAAQKLQQERNR